METSQHVVVEYCIVFKHCDIARRILICSVWPGEFVHSVQPGALHTTCDSELYHCLAARNLTCNTELYHCLAALSFNMRHMTRRKFISTHHMARSFACIKRPGILHCWSALDLVTRDLYNAHNDFVLISYILYLHNI